MLHSSWKEIFEWWYLLLIIWLNYVRMVEQDYTQRAPRGWRPARVGLGGYKGYRFVLRLLLFKIVYQRIKDILVCFFGIDMDCRELYIFKFCPSDNTMYLHVTWWLWNKLIRCSQKKSTCVHTHANMHLILLLY